MKIASTLFLFVVIGCTWRKTIGTCVFESDFGFTLNCAFKKSGLFRVRNLGGVKGYVGLGLSIGDELGFRDSLSNVESSKRRSVQTRGNLNRNDMRQVPPFKPLPPKGSRPMSQQPEHQRLVVQQNASANAIRTVPAPSLMILRNDNLRQQQRMQQELKLRQQQRLQQELLAMQVLKQQRMQQQEAMRQHQNMIQQQKVQQQMLASQIKRIQKLPQSGTIILPARMPSNAVSNVPVTAINQSSKPATNLGNNPMGSVGNLPPFIAMPHSSAQLTDRISHSPTILEEANEVAKDELKQLPLPNDDLLSPTNDMQIIAIESEPMQNSKQQYSDKRQSPVSPGLGNTNGQIQGDMQTSLKALVEASNLTLEALETAIMMRQQELRRKTPVPVVITPPTTTPVAPPVKKPGHNYGAPTKVMNAPREYYPVGYDKNFDDNFASRVDLPETRFYCGDQKHFPGLYADEDLGCMVFHVCALTDEGLIMKSFLCPESTLFDQTILKCNWWFFVDCKSSKSLYDSNIPISKSYQLMKALAFFSAYKSHDNSTQLLAEEIKHPKEPAETKEEK